MLSRRGFLAVVGTGTVAGCAGDGGGTTPTGATPTTTTATARATAEESSLAVTSPAFADGE